MTQEDKKLLLNDLCARLPYGVVVERTYIPENNGYTSKLTAYALDLVLNDNWSVKPYLRPMSSMTEEEYKEYDKETDLDVKDSAETLKENLKAKTRVRVSKWYHGNDWLNAHHFDYRGLIEKGLALEAKEGMYNTK